MSSATEPTVATLAAENAALHDLVTELNAKTDTMLSIITSLASSMSTADGKRAVDKKLSSSAVASAGVVAGVAAVGDVGNNAKNNVMTYFKHCYKNDSNFLGEAFRFKYADKVDQAAKDAAAKHAADSEAWHGAIANNIWSRLNEDEKEVVRKQHKTVKAKELAGSAPPMVSSAPTSTSTPALAAAAA
jgi:hypothetical protein